MIYPYISGINYESVADGPGVRVAIFLSGCTHNCPGCHNKQTHDPSFGQQIDDQLIDEIAAQINSRPYLTGITLTGGDPLYNADHTYSFLEALMARLLKKYTLSVWLYTGYTWEQILSKLNNNLSLQLLMDACEVVVDGPFMMQYADKALAFCGSSNQRLIDVEYSLNKGVLTLWNAET